jgi:hypothetical protein
VVGFGGKDRVCNGQRLIEAIEGTQFTDPFDLDAVVLPVMGAGSLKRRERGY